MKWSQYVSESQRTDRDFGRDMNLLHACIGMSTEINELLDALKKYFYYGKPVDMVNINEELGDFYWYLAIIIREVEKKSDESELEVVNKIEWLRQIEKDIDSQEFNTDYIFLRCPTMNIKTSVKDIFNISLIVNELSLVVLDSHLAKTDINDSRPIPELNINNMFLLKCVKRILIHLFKLKQNLAIESVSIALEKNIDKLKKRYPEKFSTENALNRDLDAERKVLEDDYSSIKPIQYISMEEQKRITDKIIEFQNHLNSISPLVCSGLSGKVIPGKDNSEVVMLDIPKLYKKNNDSENQNDKNQSIESLSNEVTTKNNWRYLWAALREDFLPKVHMPTLEDLKNNSTKFIEPMKNLLSKNKVSHYENWLNTVTTSNNNWEYKLGDPYFSKIFQTEIGKIEKPSKEITVFPETVEIDKTGKLKTCYGVPINIVPGLKVSNPKAEAAITKDLYQVTPINPAFIEKFFEEQKIGKINKDIKVNYDKKAKEENDYYNQTCSVVEGPDSKLSFKHSSMETEKVDLSGQIHNCFGDCSEITWKVKNGITNKLIVLTKHNFSIGISWILNHVTPPTMDCVLKSIEIIEKLNTDFDFIPERVSASVESGVYILYQDKNKNKRLAIEVYNEKLEIVALVNDDKSKGILEVANITNMNFNNIVKTYLTGNVTF